MAFEYHTSYHNTLFTLPKEPLSPSRMILPLLGIFVAIAFLALVVFITVKDKKFLDTAVKASGVVESVRSEIVRVRENSSARRRNTHSSVKEKTIWHATVSYKDQKGVRHTTNIRGRYSRGQQIDMLVNPVDPREAKPAAEVRNWKTKLLIFSIIPLIFLLIAFYFLVRNLQRRGKAKWLLNNGKEIRAKIIDVKSRTYYKSEGKRRALLTSYDYKHEAKEYQLVANWQDESTGSDYNFLSVGFKGAPSEGIVGQEVSVVINPNDPNSYYFGTPMLAEVV